MSAQILRGWKSLFPGILWTSERLLSKFKPDNRNSFPGRDVRQLPRRGSGGLELSKPGNVALEPEVVPPGENPQLEEELPENAFQKLGFGAALLFVFFRFSFAHEFIAAKLHFDTHLIIILGGLSYLCWLLSGQAFRAFRDSSTWLWLAFMCCMCLATSMSFWKGGSFPLLTDYLKTVFPVVFVIPALTMSRQQIKKMIFAIGFACIVTALLGIVNDDFKTGRMSIDADGSDIQDPNDYAAHLILMMPALVYLTLRPKSPVLGKIVGIGSLALCFMQILSSGSRGGFVSLALTALYIALIGSKQVKLAILVGLPALALLITPFVPKESLARLGTIFSTAPANPDSEAEGSSQARLALLRASWEATLEHPFFGVGPGIFMDYQANSAKDNGQRGMWHVTHNAYTQVSSECGLPALVLYLGALGVTMVSLRKVGKSTDKELALLARFTSVMIVGFSVCIIFLSLAYNVHILILSALVVSMKLRCMADGTWPDGQATVA